MNNIDKEVIFTVYNWIAFARNKIDVPLAKPPIRTRRMILLPREFRAISTEKQVPLILKNSSKYYLGIVVNYYEKLPLVCAGKSFTLVKTQVKEWISL